jgi:eukaryotic-like serine/threonine-protein kinase
MDPIDPDDTPTRPGGEPIPRRSSPDEERTLPAGSRREAPPNRPPASKPTPAAAAKPGAGPADPLLGKVLGGCLIEKLLGKGAMGAVYKARQQKLDRDVAIKVIRPEMMTDVRMLKRFEIEARTVGKFNSANVVMVHDVGFELGVHYLVMEFVQGKNLRDHVRLLAGGRLPVGEALPLLRQAIKGLEEAKRLEVIHRDIKPDNLMITDRGVLKIADFGIAKPVQEDFSMTLTSELVGTPLYMSPEQCQGGVDLDFRSDMYSLGATFYYLLTGEPPIRASSVYELIQTKTKLASLCLWKALPGLDENNPLSRVIERMTALDREDRYGSYEELLNDLVLVEQGQTIQIVKPGAAAAGSTPPARRPRARFRLRVRSSPTASQAAAGRNATWRRPCRADGRGFPGRLRAPASAVVACGAIDR